MMKLFIKNMVCSRCIMVVKLEIEYFGFHCGKIELGSVEIEENLNSEQIEMVRAALMICGLELINNRKHILVERIKIAIVEMVNYSDSRIKYNFSEYLSAKLGLDYTYMANTFSELEASTIERFIIFHKIQKAKALIAYNDLNLKEISWKLNYSSVAHLSSQFKKITGLTPSQFKQSSYQLAQHKV
ncbi:MAG: AraC family transcriptional regulator [Daejeonella sp.]